MSQPRRLPIVLPDLGSPRTTFSLWHVRVGDRVHEGDRVAEVLIPGATFDVPAPVTGVLVEQVVRPNDPLATGVVLGAIEADV
ncbi:MAG: lipoyl domain-containing protein [Gemmataceae bacterium]|nr:lipoyl domain-containing protein [Gemmataceae bacterium]